MHQDGSTEGNKKNEGQHSGENKRKIAREEDAWAIALDEKVVDIEQYIEQSY